MVCTLSLLLGGVAAGTLFGVCFGALASVFDGGPDLMVGIAESWAWFALVGGCMAAGWGLSTELDARRKAGV